VAREAADAADAARAQAEECARTAEERVSELECQLADASAGLAAAVSRAEAAEHQAAQAAADRLARLGAEARRTLNIYVD
jgi:hypothetical protein